MGPSYDLFHWYGWRHAWEDWAWREAWKETISDRLWWNERKKLLAIIEDQDAQLREFWKKAADELEPRP